jgi:hypothetical protein
VGPQERARPGVPGRQFDDGRPVQPVDEHRVARLAVVGGDRDGRTARVRGDQPAHRLGTDERLVRQGDHGRVSAALERAQSSHERRPHAGHPVGVVHAHHPGQLNRNGPGHHYHRIGPAAAKQRDPALGQP